MLAKGNQKNFIETPSWVLTKITGHDDIRQWLKVLGSVSTLDLKGFRVLAENEIYFTLTKKNESDDLELRKYSQN